MSSVLTRKVQTDFAKRALLGRGIGLDDAVASAEARLDSMAASARKEIAAILDEFQRQKSAIVARDPDAMTAVRVHANALAGVAGVFGMPQVGQTARSLCHLFDAASPAHPSAEAVRVHLDAFQVLGSLNPIAMNQAAPIVLAGLEDLVAAERRRNTAAATPD